MNGDTKSTGRTRPTDSPADVHDARVKEAVEKAKKKGEELVKDLADVVQRQQGPPGTPSLRKK